MSENFLQPSDGTRGNIVKVTKEASAETWAGTTITTLLEGEFISSGDTVVTLDVYAPEAGKTIRLKLEDSTNGDHFIEVDAVTNVANGWETLSFNFAAQVEAHNYDKASVFFDFGNVGTGDVYYFDDLSFSKATVPSEQTETTVTLTPTTLAFDTASTIDFSGNTSVLIDNLTVELEPILTANQYKWANNNHVYEYISAPGLTWEQANDLAEQSTIEGYGQGYLATITSAAEMAFIDTVVFADGRPNNTFVGGSDAYQEGQWRWVTGPEGLMDTEGLIFFDNGIPVGEEAAPWITYSEGNTESNDYLFIYSYWEPEFNPWNGSLGSPSAGGNAGILVEYSNYQLEPKPDNNPPIVASSVEIVLDEDTSRSGSVGAVDADGDTLSFSITTAPSIGAASITDDGSFTYTPNANAHGTDSFTITVSDGLASVTQDVSVTVNAVNDSPVAALFVLSNQYIPPKTATLSATDIVDAQNQFYWSENNHVYEFVSTGLTWEEAKLVAENKNLAGVTGHLVTITSAEENLFLSQNQMHGWIGASDQDQEGSWRWVSGPEAGQLLSYTNWDAGEPNNFNHSVEFDTGEDYAELMFPGQDQGEWNDLPSDDYWSRSFIIEYSGDENVDEQYVIATSEDALENATFFVDKKNIITDEDGLGPLNYSWQRGKDVNLNGFIDQQEWNDISGEVGESYTITQLDIGHKIRYAVSYVDGYGTIEKLYSAGIDVADVNDKADDTSPTLFAIAPNINKATVGGPQYATSYDDWNIENLYSRNDGKYIEFKDVIGDIYPDSEYVNNRSVLLTIEEGEVFVVNLNIFDTDNDKLEISIVSDDQQREDTVTDSSMFILDSEQNLYFKKAPDFENPLDNNGKLSTNEEWSVAGDNLYFLSFEVQSGTVRDGHYLVVQVLDRDEEEIEPGKIAPVLGSYLSLDLAEETAVGSLIWDVDAYDDQYDVDYTYSFASGNDNAIFAIDAETGELSLSKSLVNEQATVYNLKIAATDAYGSVGVFELDVNVKNSFTARIFRDNNDNALLGITPKNEDEFFVELPNSADDPDYPFDSGYYASFLNISKGENSILVTYQGEREIDEAQLGVVLAQLYDPSGERLGGEYLISDVLDQGHSQASAYLGDDLYLVTWFTSSPNESSLPYGENFAALGKIINAATGETGAAFIIKDKISYTMTPMDITVGNEGNIFASWYEGDSSLDNPWDTAEQDWVAVQTGNLRGVINESLTTEEDLIYFTEYKNEEDTNEQDQDMTEKPFPLFSIAPNTNKATVGGPQSATSYDDWNIENLYSRNDGEYIEFKDVIGDIYPNSIYAGRSSALLTIEEGEVFVGNLNIFDTDNDKLEISVQYDDQQREDTVTDSSMFILDSEQNLYFKKAPDFENPLDNNGQLQANEEWSVAGDNLYLLSVVAESGAVREGHYLVVQVLDRDEEEIEPGKIAPVLGSYLSLDLAEETAVGSLIWDVDAYDDQQNVDYTYSFASGNDNAIFAIDADMGELSLSKSLVNEQATVYNLKIAATDAYGSVGVFELDVNVTNSFTARIFRDNNDNALLGITPKNEDEFFVELPNSADDPDYPFDSQYYARTFSLSKGEKSILVTYDGQREIDEGQLGAVLAQLYNPSGERLGGEYVISDVLDQGHSHSSTYLGDDLHLVTWSTYSPNESSLPEWENFAAVGKIINAATGETGATFIIKDAISLMIRPMDISIDNEGNIFASWYEGDSSLENPWDTAEQDWVPVQTGNLRGVINESLTTEEDLIYFNDDVYVEPELLVANVNENIKAGLNIESAQIVLDASIANANFDNPDYSMRGQDAEFLVIDSYTGAIAFIESPNFEEKSSYEFTVVMSEWVVPWESLTYTFEPVSYEYDFDFSQTGDMVRYIQAYWTVTGTNPYNLSASASGATQFFLTDDKYLGLVNSLEEEGFTQNDLFDENNLLKENFLTKEVMKDWVEKEWQENYQDHPFQSDIISAIYEQQENTYGFGQRFEQQATINILDVNEAPTSLVAILNLTLAENSAVGSFVETIQDVFNDEDQNDTLSYSISGGNTGSVFEIDQNTGVISVAGALDYGVNSNYSLEVKATDSAGAFATTDVIIDISEATEGSIDDQPGSIFIDATQGADGLLELDLYVDARSSINALDFRFGWDESEVDYVGSDFISGWTFLDNSNASGTRDFSGYSLSGLTGSSSEYVGSIILDPIGDMDNTQVSIRDISINDETGIDTIKTLTSATGHDVSGFVGHWNGGSPLDGTVTVAGIRGDTADDIIQFRDFEVYGDGSMSVSLWSDVETQSSGSLDFVLSYSPSSLTLADYTLGSFLAGWEVLETDDPSAGELSVSALSSDLSGGNYINGDTLLGTFWFDIEEEGVAYQIGQSFGAVGETAAEASELYIRTVEVVDGSYSVEDIPPGSYQMDISRAADDVPRSAIKASDALAALKIGVGVTQDATPHQLIAADVNQNGKVNAQDALEILKIAVNHEDALDKRFVFVDADQDLSGMTARKAQYQTGIRMDDLNVDISDQDFIGILLGDVNGNYVDVI